MRHKFKIHYCKQGSDEWRKLRIGKISASEVKKLFVIPKDGSEWGRGALTYADKLVQDWLTGETKHVECGSMQWGHTYEPEARKVHESIIGCNVREVGFVDVAEGVGCSPDGLFAIDYDGVRIANGITEYKCPSNEEIHKKYTRIIEDGDIPKEHVPQVFMNMWGVKADVGDFESYDPRIGGHAGASICRVTFDSPCMKEFATIGYFEERLYAFRDLVKEMKQDALERNKKQEPSDEEHEKALIELCANLGF